MFRRNTSDGKAPKKLKKRTGEVSKGSEDKQPAHWYNWTPEQQEELKKASDRIQYEGKANPEPEK